MKPKHFYGIMSATFLMLSACASEAPEMTDAPATHRSSSHKVELSQALQSADYLLGQIDGCKIYETQ